MKSKRVIICLVGPSGSGKSTLERLLVSAGSCGRFTSTTTRPIRAGEVDGLDYHFVPDDEFQAMQERGEFTQTVNFGPGYRYAVTNSEISRVFSDYSYAVVVVEPTGVAQYEEFAKSQRDLEIISIYIDCPQDMLISRMLQRFRQDDDGCILNYTSRLIHMLNVEVNWGFARSYDKAIQFLHGGNKADEAASILKLAEEKLGRSKVA